MTKERILIVEDEENIARVLQLELEFEGYETEIAYTGTEGLIKYREGEWNLLLLDWMLPKMSGLDVLKRIRTSDTSTPVILLTAKNDVKDKVAALDLGANDYVTKPFDFEELLARIRVALRFSKKEEKVEQDVYRYSDLTITHQLREVKRNDQVFDLTPREYDLLLYFIKHPKQVLTREQILDAVWGFDYFGDTNVVDVYVRYIRKKIDFEQQVTLLQTVRGVGYVLKEKEDET
ncbi:DNA-binding response OmpR family regulator [Psychrobacillus insolitus]|uniref:DNA-binding response OmpR family regulator n=1 Tax=Psychrobacillus insolitus TaxID=1461 RepID=A0A2W7N077_9BACI|nr:response regulator transcription factor [Psychrobacillus insolitus]PZX01656.1 DNA-binding response OmpR family regulator [Psychrobacillus insolitus]